MRSHFLALSGPILFCALTIKAQRPVTPDGFELKPDQAVYIVAIRTSDQPDSRMLRLLRQAGQEKTRRRADANDRPGTLNQPASINGGALPMPSADPRPTLERSTSEPDTLISTDLLLKNKLEVEFKRQKKFKLVDSVEAADVVFFTISHYESHVFQAQNHSVTGAGIAGEATGAEMMSVVAFAIPASTYRQTRKDFTELGEVAKWEGAEGGEVTIDTSAGRVYHSVKEASAKDLVGKFHRDVLKKKNR